ncbi:hypothetical protein BX600DRAFT_482716 [Xylariales sp. PMI_506]|nr:hypothetical protein BX600DRAFT_482716 [Xylariales sp. PMI_506]
MAIKQPAPVLIIGAGLSGLTLGRLLTNAGIPNIVFEASSPERRQGFSITLRHWGYEALLSALGDVPLSSLQRGVASDRFIGGTGWLEHARLNNSTGEVLIAPDSASVPAFRANRNALREWISDCGDESMDIRYYHQLKSFQSQPASGGGVHVEFENGAKFSGSLLVGADGVHSTVRQQILPHVTPEVIPAVVYHGEFSVTPDEFEQTFAPVMGKANIIAGLGDNFNTPITIADANRQRYYLDWSYSRPTKGPDDPLYRPDASAEEAKQIPQALLDELGAARLAEPWASVLNPEAVLGHSVFSWTNRFVLMPPADFEAAAERGVVFLGDSCHAMPIFGGEGGNHAIVDAVELAEAIAAAPSDHAAAVAAFYKVAAPRTADAIRRTRQRFHIMHRPLAEWMDLAERKKKNFAALRKGGDLQHV